MSRGRKLKSKIYEIEIESLSHEGRGISHSDNKVIFTRGALPGEKVIASRTLSRAKFEEADVVEIIKSSPDRIEAKCAVYGICGGCSTSSESVPFSSVSFFFVCPSSSISCTSISLSFK